MVEGLKAGLSAAKSMGGWIGSNVTGPVVGFIKSGFGVFSPSTVTITIGGDVIAGLKKGLEAAKQMGGWLQSNVTGPVVGVLKQGARRRGYVADRATDDRRATGRAIRGRAATRSSPLDRERRRRRV